MAVNLERLRAMSSESLRELNSAIVGVINERTRARQRDSMGLFRPGDTAAFRCSRTGRLVNVRIDKHNTKTTSVTELTVDGLLSSRTWRVSPSLLISSSL